MEKKLSIITIINFIIYATFSAFIYYLSWIIWVLENALSLIILIIFSFSIYFLLKKIFRSKNILHSLRFARNFLFIFGIFLTILFWTFASTIYYYNEKEPALMPEYTISNWKKTVVFQGMIHIWSENFYNEVSKNLKNYKNEGFVHFFEWVKPGSKENQEIFNNALWVEFDKDLYKQISKVFWFVNQDYEKIIWEISENDINVDLSLDEIVEEYKKIEKNFSKNNEIISFEELKKQIEFLNERERKFIAYIWKWVLNMMISSWDSTIGWNDKLAKIIIWKRDEKLANEIINSEKEKIYVTYGLLHFNWVFENLKKNDQNWKITKTNYIKPFE